MAVDVVQCFVITNREISVTSLMCKFSCQPNPSTFIPNLKGKETSFNF